MPSHLSIPVSVIRQATLGTVPAGRPLLPQENILRITCRAFFFMSHHKRNSIIVNCYLFSAIYCGKPDMSINYRCFITCDLADSFIQMVRPCWRQALLSISYRDGRRGSRSKSSFQQTSTCVLGST